MLTRVRQLAAALVHIPSVAENALAKRAVMDRALAALKKKSLRIRRFVIHGNHCVLVTRTSGRSPRALLYAHLDVIPGPAKCFRPKMIGNKLYGRGVSDMKGPAAALIELFNETPHPDLGLLLTTDEEVGGYEGVKLARARFGLRPEIMIMPDGGDNFHLVTEEKAVLWLKITTRGESAHSSRPWLGKNAATRLVHALHHLPDSWIQEHRENARGVTAAVTVLQAGSAHNQIPGEASAVLDIRYPATQISKDIIRLLKKRMPHVRISKIIDEPGYALPKKSPAVAGLQRAAKKILGHTLPLEISCGGSDARYFPKTAVLITKPISGGHHSDHEWVDLRSLETYQALMCEFLRMHLPIHRA